MKNETEINMQRQINELKDELAEIKKASVYKAPMKLKLLINVILTLIAVNGFWMILFWVNPPNQLFLLGVPVTLISIIWAANVLMSGGAMYDKNNYRYEHTYTDNILGTACAALFIYGPTYATFAHFV